MGTGFIDVSQGRTDLPMGRGGRDIYPRDWMTSNSYIPDGQKTNTKLDNWLSQNLAGIGNESGLGALVPGQNDDAPLDEPGLLDFSRRWQTAKNLIPDLEALGPKIIMKVTQLGQIRAGLEAQGRTDLIAAMQPDIDKINADIAKWWECKASIDTYKNVWNTAASSMGLGSLGFVFIPWLTYAALAGLVVIITYGLGLVATYKHQTNVLDQVAAKNISAEAGAVLMGEAAKTTGGGVLATVGEGVSNAVTLAGIGALAYFLWSAYKS